MCDIFETWDISWWLLSLVIQYFKATLMQEEMIYNTETKYKEQIPFM